MKNVYQILFKYLCIEQQNIPGQGGSFYRRPALQGLKENKYKFKARLNYIVNCVSNPYKKKLLDVLSLMPRTYIVEEES